MKTIEPFANPARFSMAVLTLATLGGWACLENPQGTTRDQGQRSGGVEVTTAALQPEQRLTFDLPERTGPADFALVGRDFVELADRGVTVVSGSGGFARVTSAGASMTTMLGVEAHTGALISRGKVSLRERAHVHGDLTTAATVEKQNGTIVDGVTKERAALTFKPFDVVVAFPDTAQTALSFGPNKTVTTPIAPGYYRGLTVFSQTTVTLKTGSYYLDNLQIEPQATVRLDDAAGPIFVYVRQTFNFKGLLQRTTAGHPQLLVGYLGGGQAFVGGPFRGTLLAPHAEINLATVGSAGHEGAFFGKIVRVSADVRVVHRPFSWVIGSVTVDKPTPCPGDTVTVTVQANNPSDRTTPPRVAINSAPGSRRLIQIPLSYAGRRAISVVASAAGLSESRLVFVDVKGCPQAAPLPDLQFEANTYREHVVEFGLHNAATFAGTGTTYHWEFGDGTAADTVFPATTHSYSAAIARDQEFSSFDARVTVRRAGQPDSSGASTVTLWNAYAYNKGRGTLRPPAEPTTAALSAAGAAQVSIKNLESESLQFTLRRVDLQLCNPAAAPRYGSFETVSFTVAANATATHAVSVPTSSLAGVCSVAVHLVGRGINSGLPASVDAYLLVPGASTMTLTPAAQGVLSYVADRGLAVNPTRITDEELTRLTREGRLPTDVITGPLPQPPIRVLAGPGDPAGDALGTPCAPGQTAPRAGLSCQRTGWTKEAVPQIANALRGDVILSRSCGFIGGVLAKVDPPQKFSHTGIMTENYLRIRQSTGLEEYIKKHPNGDFGLPTDGFKEHALKYVWPGTLESQVREAYETGLEMTDPSGNTHHVKGFSHRAIRCDEGGVLVFPHVLKPAAERDEAVRPDLHRLVDAAKAMEGHYRFFTYTDAAIASNPGAPAWVAPKPVPTACSSFLWNAAKSINLTLDADKTNNVAGTEVLPTTPDGLYFYREQERRTAADYLYQTVYNNVDQAAVDGAEETGRDVGRIINHGLGYLLGVGFSTTVGWTSDIRDDVANQMVNCFASDSCNEGAKDSEAWKSPGDGQAVSPDDLLSWDLFAQHIEPLVYRAGENAAVYSWEASAGTGTVCGRVLLDGNPVGGATVVNTDNPLPAISQADGSFRFPATNAGSQTLTATLFVGQAPSGELLKGSVDLQVVPGNNGCVDIALVRPNLDFRRVFMDGTMFVHDEGNENQTINRATDFFTGLGAPPESREIFNTCAGDETRVETRATVTYVGQGAVTVKIKMDLYEGTCFLCNACNNNDHNGTGETSVLLCDDSSTPADCQSLATQLGITTFAIKEFTLLNFRIDNTDENSGEFGRIDSLTMSNFRQ